MHISKVPQSAKRDAKSFRPAQRDAFRIWKIK